MIPAGLFLLAVVFYAATQNHVPFDLGDEGYVLYVADALHRGQVLYRDIRIFSYMPGLFHCSPSPP